MQGPSMSSAYHTAETAYPTFYDGLVCLPGAASDFVAVEANYDDSLQLAGFSFRSSSPFTLSDGTTITWVS